MNRAMEQKQSPQILLQPLGEQTKIAQPTKRAGIVRSERDIDRAELNERGSESIEALWS